MDKKRESLQIQGKNVYTCLWIIYFVFHRYPHEKIRQKLSTGDVNKEMLIMWITWWIMWICCDILCHAKIAFICAR